jgi:uncharacterized protein YoaH (UPF0181 family)
VFGQSLKSHQDARRAKTALQSMMLMKRDLKGAEGVVSGETLDRANIAAVRLHGEHKARPYRVAIDDDGAGAADTHLASDICSGQAQLMADEIRQEQTGLDIRCDLFAIYTTLELHCINLLDIPKTAKRLPGTSWSVVMEMQQP